MIKKRLQFLIGLLNGSVEAVILAQRRDSENLATLASNQQQALNYLHRKIQFYENHVPGIKRANVLWIKDQRRLKRKAENEEAVKGGKILTENAPVDISPETAYEPPLMSTAEMAVSG